MRLMATKVRCIQTKSGKAWIFYDQDGRTAYLGVNKLFEAGGDYGRDYLVSMAPRTNRRFDMPVELKVVRARKKGGLLVHRIDNVAAMLSRTEQKRLNL